MKVHELAKQLGVTSKDLQPAIEHLGITTAPHHLSMLTQTESEAIQNYLSKKQKTVEDAAPVKKVTVVAALLHTAAVPPRTTVVPPKLAKTVKVKAEPEPPPSPEKKTFILVKKKQPPVEPAPATPPVVVPEILIPPPLPVAVLPVTTPIIKDEPAPQVIPLSTVIVSPSPSSAIKEPPAAPAITAQKTLPEKVVEQEKKKSPVDLLKPDLKKNAIVKGKEKIKRTPFAPWNPKVLSGDVAAGDSRKWQDFRPSHKRADHRGGGQRAIETPEATKPRRKLIKLYDGLTLKEFSELVGQRVPIIISKLMQLGKIMTINQPIGMEEALLLAEEFGVPAEITSDKSEEEILRPASPSDIDDPSRLTKRPPVVTIMGHVDHGKTSLLDAIRQTKVVEGEAGGITQHIGAYTVTVHDTAVTFIDTPGHEAFTAMRARGAKVTDIVILVVSADDGVMPQTIEAINHAKAANVPIIVAINKIDKPEANPDRVKTSLTEYELIPEAWGGKTIFAEISAKKKIGLAHLLEMILLQAEVLELRGNPDKPMGGVVIEAKLDRGRGPVATVLVQEGTLKVGDAFVAGTQYGRVRALIDDMGAKVKEAGLAMPVEVIGFDGVPAAGDTFFVTLDERVAKDVAQDRMHRQRLVELAHTPRVTLTDFYNKVKEGAVKELRLVIKADVQGSAGALSESIEKLSTAAVKVRVIHKGVGRITESDVLLASASEAIVIGFNVRPDSISSALAEQEQVDVRTYSIIYDAIADVKAAMEGLLDPTFKEKILGRAEVRKTFQLPKAGVISGCYVTSGTIVRGGTKARVLRDSIVVYEGKLSSLRRFKDDVKEAQTGFECGIGIENFNDMKPGDIIEVYTEEAVAAKL